MKRLVSSSNPTTYFDTSSYTYLSLSSRVFTGKWLLLLLVSQYKSNISQWSSILIRNVTFNQKNSFYVIFVTVTNVTFHMLLEITKSGNIVLTFFRTFVFSMFSFCYLIFQGCFSNCTFQFSLLCPVLLNANQK